MELSAIGTAVIVGFCVFGTFFAGALLGDCKVEEPMLEAIVVGGIALIFAGFTFLTIYVIAGGSSLVTSEEIRRYRAEPNALDLAYSWCCFHRWPEDQAPCDPRLPGPDCCWELHLIVPPPVNTQV